MKPEYIPFLKDLADVLEKHSGGFTTTIYDDGIYAMIGDDHRDKIGIGWPCNGETSRIRKIIENLENRKE